jgi:hypothetical protein
MLASVALGWAAAGPEQQLSKRWLFIWQDLDTPEQVDSVIALFPRAEAAGYNAVLIWYQMAPSRVEELKEAAKQHHLDIIPIIMANPHDPNYTEGLLAKDALFVARGKTATFQPDNPTKALNGDFEEVRGDHFGGWGFQDDEGKTIFADHEVVHSGKTALRMENVKTGNQDGHCRLSQKIKLQPYRQYHVSVWTKTEDWKPTEAEIKVITDSDRVISFQTFPVESTQDWRRHDIVFNSLSYTDATLYLGNWSNSMGRLWWDDLNVEEIGLVNALRRPGCPVTVRGENGTTYEEGRDYEYIKDPNQRIYQVYHELPVVHLMPNTRIADGERLRVSYYHPAIVYEDRLTGCLSEEKIFEDWRQEVKEANDRFHPPAFMMSHDEMRVINQCALCQSRHMTPGQLLADNVRRSAQIIRDIRPDAEVWVWNDMFDPLHNAVDDYYLVNGTLWGSWEGLDRDIGIVNWMGERKGENCRFFAERGEKEVLAGYYDGDEDGSGIAEWLKNAQPIGGIVGAMYTTWQSKYGAMEAWAKAAWGGGG